MSTSPRSDVPPSPAPERPALDGEALRRSVLVEGGLWSAVEVLTSTTSTNADVAAAVGRGAPEGLVVTAEHQSAARGRLDRRWEAPPRSALAVSVLLRPDHVPLQRWTWLPLLAGVAVDRTARDCGVASGLKWPNDVLVDGRKLCGILVERSEGPAGPAAVLGIGLNVTLSADELPVPTATSFALEGARTTDRGEVLPLLLGHLERLYRPWAEASGDPSVVREAYLERCVTVGAQVQVELPDGSTLRGRADDVDLHGRLVVDGTAVSAGDVTHVRPLL